MTRYLVLLLMFFTVNSFALSQKVQFSNRSYGSLIYENAPKLYQLETMLLETDLELNDFQVKLYHPTLNHFSMRPTVERLNNQVLISNVFFIAEGQWELQILNLENKILGTFDFEMTQKVDDTVRTHTMKAQEVYRGLEYHNGKMTGATCYINIEKVENNKKGLHCYDIKYQFMTNRVDTPKGILQVSSRITNYHRREYPKLKTCAKNIDGTTDGVDIYEENPEELVNDIFNGVMKQNKTEFHTFLSIDREEKTLYQARVHGLMWNKEWDVDCKHLEKLN